MTNKPNNTEVWKPIKGYECVYEVSNHGRVKSLIGNKYLKPYTYNGYKIVILRGKHLKVHRLVLNAFMPNKENKLQCNHKNGVKSDNRIENLEWVTRKENMKHAIENGLTNRGERNGKSKLNKKQVRVIKHLLINKWYNIKQTEIANFFKVDPQTIQSIKVGWSWKHITI